jgi:hypothetical protein
MLTDMQFPIFIQDQNDYNEFMVPRLKAFREIVQMERIAKLRALDLVDASGEVREATTEHYRTAINSFSDGLQKLIDNIIDESGAETDMEGFSR